MLYTSYLLSNASSTHATCCPITFDAEVEAHELASSPMIRFLSDRFHLAWTTQSQTLSQLSVAFLLYPEAVPTNDPALALNYFKHVLPATYHTGPVLKKIVRVAMDSERPCIQGAEEEVPLWRYLASTATARAPCVPSLRHRIGNEETYRTLIEIHTFMSEMLHCDIITSIAVTIAFLTLFVHKAQWPLYWSRVIHPRRALSAAVVHRAMQSPHVDYDLVREVILALLE